MYDDRPAWMEERAKWRKKYEKLNWSGEFT